MQTPHFLLSSDHGLQSNLASIFPLQNCCEVRKRLVVVLLFASDAQLLAVASSGDNVSSALQLLFLSPLAQNPLSVLGLHGFGKTSNVSVNPSNSSNQARSNFINGTQHSCHAALPTTLLTPNRPKHAFPPMFYLR